jgi:thioredoxin-dependent peroxiredoxin
VIQVGKKAPAFTLESSEGGKVKLSDLAGKIVVIYFYPRDNTSGCTLEAQAFRDALPDFAAAGAVVYGISKDSIASHCKFRDKYSLTFPLLTDPDGKMMEAYNAWGDKVMYGKKSKGIIRSTVLIGTDGKVVQHWPKVTVKGHVAAVLAAVSALDTD